MGKRIKKVLKPSGITLNEYLSKYNRQRVLDKVIMRWYLKKDHTNPMKLKEQWDKVIKGFHNETE